MLPVIIAFAVVLAGFGQLKPPLPEQAKSAEKVSGTPPVKGTIYFYTLLFLFICIILWGMSKPLREKMSKDIFHQVETRYTSRLITIKQDNITPGLSQSASPSMLRELGWAKLLYDNYTEIHRLSSKINFDLYRKYLGIDKNKVRSYLKKALRSSLAARGFTTFADIDFIKEYAAILDALGYYLEESWCIRCLRDSSSPNTRIKLLVAEYYAARPYLYH